MKTNNFMHFMAVAVVFAGMVMFTSCNKDDFELPEVIESEVLNQGLSEEIKTETTEQGTKLSYESWITVKGQTRAAFENKVAVTLNNSFNNIEEVIEITDINLGDCRTQLGYELNTIRQEGFVTVSDSILIYKVMFKEFSFTYDLFHEIAVYDDKITRQTMPYYPIYDIRDNGYTLSDLDFVIEDNGEGQQLVYLRKQLNHSISFAFNGKAYTLSAKIELRKNAGVHPAILSSEVVKSGISDVEHNTWASRYSSWIELKHHYSDGNVANKTYKIEAMQIGIDFGIQKYKELPDADIKMLYSGFAEEIQVDTVGMPNRMVICEQKRNYKVKYNHFTLDYPVHEYRAYYDDGINHFEMPSLSYSTIREEHNLRYIGDYVGEERDYKEYFFTQYVYADVGDATHKTVEEFQVIVYTE